MKATTVSLFAVAATTCVLAPVSAFLSSGSYPRGPIPSSPTPFYQGGRFHKQTSKKFANIEGSEKKPEEIDQREGNYSYIKFAKDYPFANNVGIATVKTAAADLLAQTAIAGIPVTEIDLQRSLLFCLFGALYLGAFQCAYQVNIFKKLFDVDSFTNKAWSEKLQDMPGLKALGAQTGLDLSVLTLIYLPTFYIFKASIFSASVDPSAWFETGIDNYQMNFSKDEADLLKVWLPADLVCFSVPLYLRLPVRHVVSFIWTAYLSFARGGH